MQISKLKMIRLVAGLTCAEMGHFIGIHPTQYSRLENQWDRRISATVNNRLVAALGEGFDFLMQPVEVGELEPIVRRVEKSVAASNDEMRWDTRSHRRNR